MLKRLKIARLWLGHQVAEIRNVYTHRSVGQTQGRNGETIILYTILGKRDVYRISIEKLMEDKDLLERFHPCQTVKFGVISLGDVLFQVAPEQRKTLYQKIKSQMLPLEEV